MRWNSCQSTVGVADTSPPSVGTRFQCLATPIPFVITTTISSYHTYTYRECGDESQRDGLQPDCLGSPRSRPVQVRTQTGSPNSSPSPPILLYPPALDASTLRTSDWDMPNCRAMSLGLIPALNAARTALICPRVNESGAGSTCRPEEDLSVRDERFVV